MRLDIFALDQAYVCTYNASYYQKMN